MTQKRQIISRSIQGIERDTIHYKRMLPAFNSFLKELKKIIPVKSILDVFAALSDAEDFIRTCLASDPVKVGNLKISKAHVKDMIELPDLTEVMRTRQVIISDKFFKHLDKNAIMLTYGKIELDPNFIEIVTNNHTQYCPLGLEKSLEKLKQVAELLNELRKDHQHTIGFYPPMNFVGQCVRIDPENGKFIPNIELLSKL